MKRIIGIKEKKALLSYLFMIAIYIIFLVVCILRLLVEKNIILIITFIGLALIVQVFLTKEIKNLYTYLKSPNNLLVLDDNKLRIYATNKENLVLLDEITNIEEGANNNKIIFFEANIIIHTKESKYIIQNISNVKEVFQNLKELLK